MENFMFCAVSAKRGGEGQGECNYRNFRLWKNGKYIRGNSLGTIPLGSIMGSSPWG